ncbi:MAG: DUF2071 domain-containing protein [Nocardioides sp.]
MTIAGEIRAAGPPLPNRQIMGQWWRDITFLHWRVPPERVVPLMPRGVTPDVYDGSAWVGLIPFRMVGGSIGRRGPIPWLGTFCETNVRLYSIDAAGRRGVVFRSLEAERLLVVTGARIGFNVPYQWARMRMEPQALGEDPAHAHLTYTTRRRGRAGVGGRISIEVGAPVPEPTELDHFLTARFGLHTTILGRPAWVPNSHGPWPLRRARLLDLEDSLVAAAGLPGVTGSAPDSVLFSSGVHTVFGLPRRG